MPKRPHAYNIRNLPLTTWMSDGQARRFRAVAEAHGVSAAAFLRAIVLDALADEADGFSVYLDPQGRSHYYVHPRRLKSQAPVSS